MTKIHLVTHTHWDREWYQTFQQFRFKLVSLVDHLLQILDDDPRFSSFLLDGQAIILEDYLQIRPEREPDLIRYVRNGRIFIGPWYISPDEFLVAPESHIRNLLEGERICSKFGKKMAVGYLPDTFGHIGQMPQILAGFGIDTACLWRGLDDQPCELEWIAPDGSSVLLAYLRESYSNAASLTPSDPEKFSLQANEMTEALSGHCLSDQVLLLDGTDHMEPSGDLPDAVAHYVPVSQEDSLVISNLSDYYTSVRASLAKKDIQILQVSGELRSSKRSALLPNVLSTRITLKQRNHACESQLLKWVEPLNAWVKLAFDGIFANGSQPPKGNESFNSQDQLIRQAWKMLMQCHPHDSICGTSIDQVIDEMEIRFDQVDQLTGELKNQSMKTLSDWVNTNAIHELSHAGTGKYLSCIIVFNPNDQPQTGLIHSNIQLDAEYSSFELVDQSGASIPFDQSGSGAFELISMKLDKKAMKQALGMINDGNIAGFSVRDFEITKQGSRAEIHATLSDHASVDMNKWKQGNELMERMFADPQVNEFVVHASSDPETNISFVAADVPQHGYSCYWIRGKSVKNRELAEPARLNPILQRLLPVLTRLTQSPLISSLFLSGKQSHSKSLHQIENEFFTVTAHPGSDGIEIYDKRSNKTFTNLNQFIDGGDCGDVYNYSPPEVDSTITAKIKHVEVEEHSSHCNLMISYAIEIPAALSANRKSRSTDLVKHTIKSTVTLVPGIPRIDIQTEIENLSSDHRLRVHFPTPIRTPSAFHDGHFEIVERNISLPQSDDTWAEPPRPEVPQRLFSSIADENLSLTVANLGLPEVEAYHHCDGLSGLAVTLLRCVGWLSRDDFPTRKGHAGPMNIATPGAQMIGKHTFDYSIIPGDANWDNSVQQAITFNAPLQAVVTSLHPGYLPAINALIENLNSDFIITTIKSPENGHGLVVRGYNRLSTPIEVRLKAPGSLKKAFLVRMDEEILEQLPELLDGHLNITLRGNQITTILLTK